MYDKFYDFNNDGFASLSNWNNLGGYSDAPTATVVTAYYGLEIWVKRKDGGVYWN